MIFACGDNGCTVLPDDAIKPDPVNYPEFSKRLKEARRAKRITQFDMADLLGISSVHYSKFDNGHEFPPPDILEEINRILFDDY